MLINCDALGSVRQLTDAGGATLSQSYDPYGEVISSEGGAASVYGYDGEWTDVTGLVYLRSRYYGPSQGRFITRDTWGGDANSPMSYNLWMYGYGNPVKYTDPSGYSSSGCLPIIGCSPTAGQAVDFFRWFYSKGGPIILAGEIHGGRFDCNNRQWSLPQETLELAADYICERGPEHVFFHGQDNLTHELAYSVLIDQVRKHYYDSREGDLSVPTELRFNIPQYSEALLDAFVNYNGPMVEFPITHFLGSFDYTVVRSGLDRIRFQIDNRTDLSSGTHLPGRWPPDDQRNNPLSLEQVIDESPQLANRNAVELLNERPDIISILKIQERTETGGLGGGAMRQTFTWTERRLMCGLENLPWPVYLSLLDVR